MRFALALALLAATLSGCKSREETSRMGADTVVTSRETQDTAVITHDTTIKVDTNIERGERTTRADTVKKTRGTVQPTDTTSR